MPNGSLETWLHQEEGHERSRTLNILQRLNIAIDVASALLYLHHHCHTPIVHCDLKPSNVLLDDDMTALVSDFGMARFLSESGKEALLNQFSSAGIQGTIGYAAPEYGMGNQPSTKGDVYSFGILLLELFTGKSPTDKSLINNLNLHNFVRSALPGTVDKVVDLSVFCDGATDTENKVHEQTECLISILQIGVACSAEYTRDRMNMRRAIMELRSVRDKLLGTGIYEKNSSPEELNFHSRN